MPQKKLLKNVLPVMLLIVALFIPAIQTNASNIKTFSKSHGKPSAGITSGYLEIYWGNKSGTQEGVDVYYWSILPYKGSDTSNLSNSTMGLVIGDSNGDYYLKFNAGVGNAQLGYFTLVALYTNSQVLESTNFTSTHSYEVDYSSSYTIYGYHVYGNFRNINEKVADYAFYVNYGSDSEYLTLVEIINALNNMNDELGGKLDDVITEISNMATSVENASTSLNAIYSYLYSQLPNISNLIGATNTKLDEMYDLLNQLYFELTNSNPSDEHKMEDFGDTSDSQSTHLNEMNDSLAVNKPSSDTISKDFNHNIDMNSIGVIGSSLAVFFNNQYILKMLIASLSLCLVGYIFFGKRG